MVDPPVDQDPLALVTKEELAGRLRKTVRTVNHMIARRELPRPFRLGNKAYWRRGTLARHLAELERKGA